MVIEKLMIFDYIGWFFWTLTYIVIIITGAVNKKSKYVGIPVMPVLVNFSWEIASVVNPTNFVRIVWFLFDIFIVALIFQKQNLRYERKKLISYTSFLFICTVIFYFIFKNNDMVLPISSFFIDTVMAIIFLIQRKKIDSGNRVLIGVLKFLGDAFVWVYFASFHPSISVLAAITFICNIVYIVYAVKEAKAQPEIQEEFKGNLKSAYAEVKRVIAKINKRRKPDIVHGKKKKKKKTKKTHRG